MGYESRVFVGARLQNGNHCAFIRNAVFGLGKMNYEIVDGKRFVEVFDKKVDFEVYNFGTDEPIEKDNYGDELTYCSVKDLLKWMRAYCDEDDYWETNAFRMYLEALPKSSELVAVHFGY